MQNTLHLKIKVHYVNKCFINICLKIHVNEILFFLMAESGHSIRARQNCAEEYTIELSALRFRQLHNLFILS